MKLKCLSLPPAGSDTVLSAIQSDVILVFFIFLISSDDILRDRFFEDLSRFFWSGSLNLLFPKRKVKMID